MPDQGKLHARRRPLLVLFIGASALALGSWRSAEARNFFAPLGEPEKKPEGAPAERVAGQEAPPAEKEEEYDWKEAAYQRQMEKIAARKRKQQPDYKESAYEKKVRLRKMAMWNAAQRKGVNEVGSRDTATVDIKVTLQKPLGIEFEERDNDPNRVWVSNILEEGAAFKDGEVEVGDYLATVNGVDVQNRPMPDALQFIIDAEGDINLVFKRIFVA
mmetsp:Transcript_29907/g.56085  ORF Transcript_29907/g.56085 Transcript_29907/m.56085 type:complete len:216 (-) Transcript_29907:107-754(-)